MDLANTLRQYISPSLRSFKLSCFLDLSDEQLSNFLSTILLVEESVTTSTMPTKITTGNENVSFPLEDLTLTAIPTIGRETLSVITKWLRPNASATFGSASAMVTTNDTKGIVGKDSIEHHEQQGKFDNKSPPHVPAAMTTSTTSLPPLDNNHYHYRKSLSIATTPFSSIPLPLDGDFLTDINSQFAIDGDFLHALSASKLKSLTLRFRNELSEEDFPNLNCTLYQCQRYLKVLDLSGCDLSNYSSSSIEQLLKSIAGSSPSSTSTNSSPRVLDREEEQYERKE